jgi:Predicted pyridoxal phosphate-dependent enzyme apparently involved in regulation of cell wall biogenesis
MNSGTSALHAIMLSQNIKKNDEILVPSFTFISTVNSALMVDAKPKFVDIETDTYGMDPKKLEKVISKNSKIIMPIHYSGLPCQIEKIRTIAKKHKKILIEDSAESIGAKVNGKKVGTFGDASIFSFAGNKVLTTGEGGAITTNSSTLAKKLKLIRSHGRKIGNYFLSTNKPEYTQIGYNWRMSSITAAIGISQLEKIEKIISLRRKNANSLNSHFKKIPEIVIPPEPKNSKHVYQLYSILVPNSTQRNKLQKFLESKGIMSKVFFYPVHETTYYKKMQQYSSLKNTEDVSKRILSLPLYPTMTKQDLNLIKDSISEIF